MECASEEGACSGAGWGRYAPERAGACLAAEVGIQDAVDFPPPRSRARPSSAPHHWIEPPCSAAPQTGRNSKLRIGAGARRPSPTVAPRSPLQLTSNSVAQAGGLQHLTCRAPAENPGQDLDLRGDSQIHLEAPVGSLVEALGGVPSGLTPFGTTDGCKTRSKASAPSNWGSPRKSVALGLQRFRHRSDAVHPNGSGRGQARPGRGADAGGATVASNTGRHPDPWRAWLSSA